MRAANLVTASVLLLLGGVAIFDSVRLGIGWGTDGPKSGFFPFWLGLLLIVSLGLIVVRAAFRASAKPFVSREQLRLVLKVLWPATAMVVLTQVASLFVASALYLGFYSGRRLLFPDAIAAALVAAHARRRRRRPFAAGTIRRPHGISA
jgi:hypothetical protein